jgi:rhomboid protease GluP
MSDIQPTPSPEQTPPAESPEAVAPEALAPASEISPAQIRLQEFQADLARLTPHVYVTPILLALNILVFVLMVVFGFDLNQPKVLDLIRWGGNAPAKTASGEWWRLLTNTFVHLSVVQLAVNMWALASLGWFVERMVGNIGFLLLYLVSAITGSLATLLFSSMPVSVGAGGPLFGVIGAFLALVLRKHDSIPPETLGSLRNTGIAIVVLNLVLGYLVPNMDNSSSLGGLVGGFLCGLVLSLPSVSGTLASRPVRNLLAAVLGCLLIAGGVVAVSFRDTDSATVRLELLQFGVLESKALKLYNDGLTKVRQHQLTEVGLADLLERNVLPEWRAAYQRLSVPRRLPPELQRDVTAILNYIRLRQESWELLVEAGRENDPDKRRQALEKNQLANEAIRQMNKADGK